jgi:non-specific serine/threonine protein kinase/serine/threonine-protein kinase
VTREAWKQVKSIFDQAADLDPSARTTFLEEACAGDAELRAEVDSLLASLDDAGEFLERPPTKPAVPSLRIGTSLGPYQIVQVVGEGGMGTVYQGVRVDDIYRKLVAIKVVKTGLHSATVLRRFETERQILAHLDHPNIARLLDGGTTPEGQPYFVMDFIAGKPIDEYCDQKRLTIPERLALFLSVCSAVQYAHQNLVIHRDLKPANILISDDGVARLLDFGIAKMLDGDKLPSGSTSPSIVMLTPQYASPEQLNGSPVTTAADVYALGGLLYELLTGHIPYALTNRSAQEFFHKICNEEPRKPSAVVRISEAGIREDVQLTPEKISNLRGVRPDRLVRQLSGDLDNILMLALRKEPQRRYASVEQFAADIRNHLEEIPVVARPDTIRYRTVKFIRRNTAAVLAGSLFVVALLAGIAATSWQAHVASVQRQRAEQRFNDVRELANSVLFELHDAIEPLPGSTKVRELLIKKAQHYLDHLATDATTDEALQHERAIAYERIGDVLGLPTKANLGNTQGALVSYQHTLDLERPLAAAHPDDIKLQSDMARALNRICAVEQSVGRFQDALRHCGETVRIEEALARNTSSQDWGRDARLASVYQTLAGAYFAVGDWPQSEQYRARCLQTFERLHQKFPDNENYEFELGNAHLRMANVQEQMKHYEQARDNAAKSVAYFEAISARHPNQARRKLSTTYALQRLGSVLISLNDLPGAHAAFLQSVPIREQILALDPMDASAQVNMSNTLAAVGFVLLKMGRPSEALPYFQRQRALAAKLVENDPMRIEHSYSLSEAIENSGMVALANASSPVRPPAQRKEDLVEARRLLTQALAIYDSLQARGAVSAEYAGVPSRIKGELASCDGVMNKVASTR